MNSTQNQPTVSNSSIESSKFTRRTNSTQNQPTVVPNSLLQSIESSKFTGRMNLTENRPTNVSSVGKTKKLWCEDLSAKYPLVLNFTHLVTKEKKNRTKLEPINYHPYQYIFNASHVCKANESVKVVIVVKSRVDHFSLRNIIRETWVKEAVADGSKVVFSLGNSKKKPVREKVNEEYKKFKDVVQEDFYDHYYNNSLKTIMGIRWIAMFCSNAIYVLMVDDDVIVNYRNLANFFKSVSSDSLEILYSGNIKPTPGPIRNRRVRWYMPENQFPFDCYPPYLSGGALLTSGEVIRKMNIALPYVKKFKYDDVYLAIIVQKLGIRPQGNPRVTMRKAGAKHLKNIIVSHGFSKSSDYSKAYQIIME
ncbi:hypothetical protein FSP39_022108 [Pinctada imbricata]|uniref:Hexosyltransferase n=1 Tax=Pinctada imbricata TaxID=66713 RepID=A0AA89BZZ6_PINIB|nr:hypothetical protein FSP39_022108 [Pinctada imbricata]